MNDIIEYLKIPKDYEWNRYSLSWSASGDAVERPDGSAFAMATQIAFFIEGYASTGPLIHFSYILCLIQLLEPKPSHSQEPGLPRLGPGRELLDRADLLARAFRAAESPHRNAGALCAWLCRDVPPVVSPPDWIEVYYRLRHGSHAPQLAVRREVTDPLASASVSPPLSALDFEMRFLNALRKLSPEEITSWLEYGRPSLAYSGTQVAETVEAIKPKTLEGVIAALEDRERSAAANPMVAQFLSALTLPPRRLAHQALPTGGYADIATRGRPEQILPSQFAIDNIEFLRRFAENELLYFHREEPHTPQTEELILLLDQGVRTWGKVRHALAASALALAKLALKKKIRLLLTSTGSEGRLVDPLTVEDESLGAFWESSDLAPNPSLALHQVLRTPSVTRRDLIVLTHPRNVAEPEFLAAARRLDASSRLFTVAIDEPGSVQFREWRRAVPVKLADFRVDSKPPSPTRRKPPAHLLPDPRGWKGDVEPVPFPFRIGVSHKIDRPLFDFDQSGRWLLLSTHRGLLHAWKLDGSAAELLPRTMVSGSVLEHVDSILGVANGFVVCGRSGKSLVATYYNFESRTARAYVFEVTFDAQWTWVYCSGLNTVVAMARGKDHQKVIDLSTQESDTLDESRPPKNRRFLISGTLSSEIAENPPRLPIVEAAVPQPARGGFVRFDRGTGEITLERVTTRWPTFIPKTDGQPILKGCWLDYAQLRGNVLALLVSDARDDGRGSLLRLFRTHQPDDDGLPVTSTRELTPCSKDPSSLMLSHDGKLIARKLGDRQIEVRETGGNGQTVFVTVKGKSHTDPKVTLGRYGLIIHVGKQSNLIRWDRGKLTVWTVAEGSTRSEHDTISWPLDRPAQRSTPLPKLLAHDPHRFVACARAELTAVVDCFGQVALFDAGERLIAMFVAFRSHVAAWMPDGTRFGLSHGASPLLDGPATPNAAEIIGSALKEASDAALRSNEILKPASSR